MKKITIIFLLIIFDLTATTALAQPKLIFALDLIRHGARTPLKALPKAPYPWQGLGELTPLGMAQEYQLGVGFRKLYINEYHLLPEHYNIKMMSAFSDTDHRTIMSAQCLLYGLYPLGTGPKLNNQFALPEGWQPIPVTTTLVIKPPKQSPEYNKALQTIAVTPDWRSQVEKYQSQYNYLSQATGLKITSIDDLVQLGADFYIRIIHHIPLPKGISNSQAKELIALSRWAVAKQYGSPEMANLMGKPLLQQIQNFLIHAANSNSSLKYVLLSGHDTTILPVMAALGAPLQTQPPFASDVKFLLFKDKNKFQVEVIYNNKSVLLPYCKQQTRCLLSEFVSHS